MQSLPKDFVEKMEKLLGDEYKDFSASFEADKDRHMALRLNTSKCDDIDRIFAAVSAGESPAAVSAGEDLAEDSGKAPESVPWEARGFYYNKELAFGKHPYHEAGLYYIQEPSAMAPVHFLDAQPGERILDLCAAPGGKSTQIADSMKGRGILVTNEINRDRAKILSLNIERMGIGNAVVLSEDSSRLSEVFEGYFDRILVDAPCSGEGMFRKNESALSEWSLDNVRNCAQRQREILDNAAKMLLPGGRLVYSTCTFSPEENEQTIAHFLKMHPDFHTEKQSLAGGMESGRCEWAGDEANDPEISAEIKNTVRLWPHRVRGEGHFLCVLKRDGFADKDAQKNYVPGGRFIRAKKEVIKTFMEFAAQELNVTESEEQKGDIRLILEGGKVLEGGIMTFGDQLFLAPSDMPSCNGLKVLRCGLHLGTVKKERFEPSHALALVLSRESVKIFCDIKSDSQQIRQYLNGQTIRLTGDDPKSVSLQYSKGWCLVMSDGFSIGWAKLAGGMLKNHYPKGLRINY